MAFIPFPDGIKIEIKCKKGGAPNINIVWGVINITLDLAALESISDAVVAWWTAEIRPLVSTSTTLEAVTVTDMSNEAGLQWVNDLVTPLAGTATGGDLPSNVAAVVTFYTGQVGRSYRGRVYNPGLTDTQVTTNTLGTTYVTNMLTAWAEFNIAMDTAGVTHCVASHYTNGAPRSEVQATAILEYGMNNVVDTQRRRIPQVDN